MNEFLNYKREKRNINNQKSDIIFYLLCVKNDKESIIDNDENEIYKLYLNGITNENELIIVEIDYNNYFYIEIPINFDIRNIKDLKKSFKHHLNLYFHSEKIIYDDFELEFAEKNIEILTNECEYITEKNEKLIKISSKNSIILEKLNSLILYYDIEYENNLINRKTYNYKMPITIKYLQSEKIKLHDWLEIKSENYILLLNNIKYSIEYDIFIKASFKNLNLIKNYPEKPKIRLVSFDIECINKNKSFPNPIDASIIQIGTVCKTLFSFEKIIKLIFTYKNVSYIEDAISYSYESEKEMLIAWVSFMHCYDPDILIGYNIISFDIKFIIARLEFLSIEKISFYKDRTIILDVMRQIKFFSNFRWRKLNDMGLNFLNDKKHDIKIDELHHLQEFSDESRKKIAVYCIQDCVLTFNLFEKLNIWDGLVMFSKNSGISITDIVISEKIEIIKNIFYNICYIKNNIISDIHDKLEFNNYILNFSIKNESYRYLHYFLTLEGIKLISTQNISKDIVLQVLEIMKYDEDDFSYYRLIISDGCFKRKAICSTHLINIEKLQKYNIILVKKFNVKNNGNYLLVFIDEFLILYTNIDESIGWPYFSIDNIENQKEALLIKNIIWFIPEKYYNYSYTKEDLENINNKEISNYGLSNFDDFFSENNEKTQDFNNDFPSTTTRKKSIEKCKNEIINENIIGTIISKNDMKIKIINEKNIKLIIEFNNNKLVDDLIILKTYNFFICQQIQNNKYIKADDDQITELENISYLNEKSIERKFLSEIKNSSNDEYNIICLIKEIIIKNNDIYILKVIDESKLILDLYLINYSDNKMNYSINDPLIIFNLIKYETDNNVFLKTIEETIIIKNTQLFPQVLSLIKWDVQCNLRYEGKSKFKNFNNSLIPKNLKELKRIKLFKNKDEINIIKNVTLIYFSKDFDKFILYLCIYCNSNCNELSENLWWCTSCQKLSENVVKKLIFLFKICDDFDDLWVYATQPILQKSFKIIANNIQSKNYKKLSQLIEKSLFKSFNIKILSRLKEGFPIHFLMKLDSFQTVNINHSVLNYINSNENKEIFIIN